MNKSAPPVPKDNKPRKAPVGTQAETDKKAACEAMSQLRRYWADHERHRRLKGGR